MKNSNGFTLIELVVTIMLVGILLGTAIPTFHRVVSETQKQVNVSNMGIIKDTFMQYYYDNHMSGNPHFTPIPTDSLLDKSYREIILTDGRTPNDLFSGDLPNNTNDKPYTYYWDNDSTSEKIIIKDNDTDSPSYGEYVIGEI